MLIQLCMHHPIKKCECSNKSQYFVCFTDFAISMCFKRLPKIEYSHEVFLLGYKMQGMVLRDIVIILKSVLHNIQNYHL